MSRTKQLAQAYDRRKHPDLPKFAEPAPQQQRAERWARDINDALGNRTRRAWQV